MSSSRRATAMFRPCRSGRSHSRARSSIRRCTATPRRTAGGGYSWWGAATRARRSPSTLPTVARARCSSRCGRRPRSCAAIRSASRVSCSGSRACIFRSAVVDRIAAGIRRVAIPDLAPYGLAAPRRPYSAFLERRVIPIVDVGLAEAVRTRPCRHRRRGRANRGRRSGARRRHAVGTSTSSSPRPASDPASSPSSGTWTCSTTAAARAYATSRSPPPHPDFTSSASRSHSAARSASPASRPTDSRAPFEPHRKRGGLSPGA